MNLLFILAIVAGVLTFLEMPVELNPDVSFETAAVVTRYQGASPEEAEELLTIPLEDEIKKMDRINRVVSNSAENQSTILVEYESEIKDFKEAVRELRAATNIIGNTRELDFILVRLAISNPSSW